LTENSGEHTSGETDEDEDYDDDYDELIDVTKPLKGGELNSGFSGFFNYLIYFR